MKRTILSVALLTGLSTSAVAGTNSWEKEAHDAWIDGKAEATILFNGNLNSFDINTDVENGIVSLTGKVDSEVDKELAEELVLSIDGVRRVDNDLTVLRKDSSKESDISANITDAKISTVITSRFLFDSEVSGTSIDVDVDDKKVTLNGEVSSEAERDLAVSIAQNTNDIELVNDNLIIIEESE